VLQTLQDLQGCTGVGLQVLCYRELAAQQLRRPAEMQRLCRAGNLPHVKFTVNKGESAHCPDETNCSYWHMTVQAIVDDSERHTSSIYVQETSDGDSTLMGTLPAMRHCYFT
jgi:hypothetical protein